MTSARVNTTLPVTAGGGLCRVRSWRASGVRRPSRAKLDGGRRIGAEVLPRKAGRRSIDFDDDVAVDLEQWPELGADHDTHEHPSGELGIAGSFRVGEADQLVEEANGDAEVALRDRRRVAHHGSDEMAVVLQHTEAGVGTSMVVSACRKTTEFDLVREHVRKCMPLRAAHSSR